MAYWSSRRSNARAILAKLGVLLLLGSTICTGALLAYQTLYNTSDATQAAGAATQGGIAPGTSILHVDSLADDGPGSLRAALATEGPKVVVFDTSGTIRLTRDLKIDSPHVTIAGQTAPSPGITLTGGSLRIRSHDIIVQHITVSPGPAATPKENDNRDSISIDGASTDPDRQSFQVRLENVTATWSVDETVSLWYPHTHDITVTNSIIAEALNHAGHPKGMHSMGLLVGPGVRGVQITGNLLVSNAFRNPAITQGAAAYVANNYIFNPGQNAIHFYRRDVASDTRVSLIANYLANGKDTKAHIAGILVLGLIKRDKNADLIFIKDNSIALGPKSTALAIEPGFELAAKMPITSATWTVLPAARVPSFVLRYAGARPLDRSVQDRQLIAGVRSGASRIIDAPRTDLSQPVNRAVAAVPKDPFGLTSEGRTRLEQWLCEEHLKVGGMPSASCRPPDGGPSTGDGAAASPDHRRSDARPELPVKARLP